MGGLRKSSNLVVAVGLAILGITVAAGGIYLCEADDAPGASLIGILLMIGALVLAVRVARRKA